mgnify:FL=1
MRRRVVDNPSLAITCEPHRRSLELHRQDSVTSDEAIIDHTIWTRHKFVGRDARLVATVHECEFVGSVHRFHEPRMPPDHPRHVVDGSDHQLQMQRMVTNLDMVFDQSAAGPTLTQIDRHRQPIRVRVRDLPCTVEDGAVYGVRWSDHRKRVSFPVEVKDRIAHPPAVRNHGVATPGERITKLATFDDQRRAVERQRGDAPALAWRHADEEATVYRSQLDVGR